MNKAFTQRYVTQRIKDGFSFTFYCDLCQRSYETEEIKTESFTEALQKAQSVAYLYFNKCHKCGKWICDEHYDESIMECVECSALKTRKQIKKNLKNTRKCKKCGTYIEEENCFCTLCGRAIQ